MITFARWIIGFPVSPVSYDATCFSLCFEFRGLQYSESSTFQMKVSHFCPLVKLVGTFQKLTKVARCVKGQREDKVTRSSLSPPLPLKRTKLSWAKLHSIDPFIFRKPTLSSVRTTSNLLSQIAIRQKSLKTSNTVPERKEGGGEPPPPEKKNRKGRRSRGWWRCEAGGKSFWKGERTRLRRRRTVSSVEGEEGEGGGIWKVVEGSVGSVRRREDTEPPYRGWDQISLGLFRSLRGDGPRSSRGPMLV